MSDSNTPHDNGVASTGDAASSEMGLALGDAGLLKVQDLLFGNHIRTMDERFAAMENKLLDLEEELEERIKRGHSSLETRLRTENDALVERLKTQSQIRDEAETALRNDVGQLARDLEEALRRLEKRDSELEEELKTARTVLTAMVESNGDELAAELRRSVAKLAQTLNQAVSRINDAKADQSFLADRLIQLGMQLKTQKNPSAASTVTARADSSEKSNRHIEFRKNGGKKDQSDDGGEEKTIL